MMLSSRIMLILSWWNMTKGKSKKREAKLNREQGQLISESGFVLRTAPPSLSRDGKMKIA